MNASRWGIGVALALATVVAADETFSGKILENLKSGNRAAAESLAVAWVAHVEATAPVDSLELARANERFAHVYWASKKEVPRAREAVEASLAIRLRHLSEDHVDVAQTFYTLGRVQAELGEFEEAESSLARARRIYEKSGKPIDTAKLDAEVGTLYYKLSRNREALAYFERAHAPLEEALGFANPEVIRVVYVTGLIHQGLGQPKEAIPWLEKAKVAYESAYGADSMPYSYPLAALGSIYVDLGKHDLAESNLRAAMEIIERHAGRESPQLSWALNALGRARTSVGDYVGARGFIERALELQRDQPNRYPYTMYLGFLARNANHLGDPYSALDLFNEALAARKEFLDEKSVSLGELYNHIALLEERLGRYEPALAGFEQAFAIAEEGYGADDFRTGLILSSRASALARLGRFAEAEPLAARAREIVVGVRGERHLDVAAVDQVYARVFQGQQQYASARARLEDCLETRQQLLGPEHPHVGGAYADLAEVAAEAGDVNAALEFAVRAERIGRDHFRTVASSLSERRALQYAATRPSGLDCALALAAEHPSAVRDAWDELVASRALVLDEMAERLRATWVSESATVDSLRIDLAAVSRHLAHLLVQGPDPDDAQSYRVRLEQAREKRDRCEATLADASAYERERKIRKTARLDDIERVLPDDGVLVAFASFGREEPVMMAFVLDANTSSPIALSLGSAARIDEAVSDWRSEASQGALRAGRTPDEALAAYRLVGARLRELVWDPLVPTLRGRRVFVVPDGALHLVNFAALPIGEDCYLLDDDRTLHLLSAERDLIPSAELSQGGLLAVGGATFDDAFEGDEPPVLFALRGELADCATFRDLRFTPLPRSGEEAHRVAARWKGGDGDVLLLEGAAAHESAVKQAAPGRRFLHFATHGFFIEPDCALAAEGGSRGVGGLTPSRSHPGGERPLRLAGIALAGANRRDETGPSREDGILTAEEIATLDLREAQWCVLSACDTGVGDVEAREGVFGLRRAFRVAGARTVISSLWSVRDDDALRWMDELYQARLHDGLDTAASTRRASRRILADLRARNASTHPFAWAAFVAAGEWR